MKKQLAIVLALLLVLPMILCACGKQEEDVRGQIDTRPTETSASDKEETAAPTEEDTVPPTEEDTTPPTEEDTAAPTEEEVVSPTGEGDNDNPVTMGRIQGGIYTNDYLGFGMELDDSWEFYTADELQDIPDNVAELLADTEMGDSVAALNQFTEMMAESSEALATINTQYQKLSIQEQLLYLSMSSQELLEATMEEKDMLIRSYGQVGIDVESMDIVSIDFLGETCPAIKTVASTQDIPYYILQVFFFDKGQYGVTMTFSSYVEDITEDLASLCYALD